MIVSKFIPDLCWYPIEGTLNDLFDHNFKLVAKVYDYENPEAKVEVPPNTVGFGILWKGVSYIITSNSEGFTTPNKLICKWVGETPTIEDLLKSLDEEIPNETTTYNYSWITVVKYNENGELDPNGKWYVTDKLDAYLLVKTSGFSMEDILKYAGIGLIAIGVIGLVLEKPEYAKKAYEYVKERAPKVYEHIKEKAPEVYEKLKEELAKLKEELRKLRLREEIERIIKEEIGKLKGRI